MSNFQFLEPEFKSLAATAKEAEKLTYISPQFALAAARTSLENLVLWLYQYDKKLTQPYDASLHNLLNDLKFKDLILDCHHSPRQISSILFAQEKTL